MRYSVKRQASSVQRRRARPIGPLSAACFFAWQLNITPSPAALLPLSSSAFGHLFEMNSVADGVAANGSTSEWTLYLNGNVNSFLSGGFLSVDTTVAPPEGQSVISNESYWVSNTWPADASSSVGWTMEAGVNVQTSVDTSNSDQLAMQLEAGTSNRSVGVLDIGLYGTYWAQAAGGITTYDLLDSTANDGQTVAFRIAQDANSNTYYVWRNGVEIGSNLAGYTTSDHAQLLFGDGTSGFSGSAQFKYIRWDSTGAYSPQAYTANTWAISGSGDWNVSSNWGGIVPNDVGAEADMLGAIGGNQTVFTNAPITLGTLRFNTTAGSYYVAGAGPLTLQVYAGSALVSAEAGAHTIQLPTIIASNTTFNADNGASLTVSGPITVNAGEALTTTTTGTGAVIYESSMTLQNGSNFSLASPAGPAAIAVGTGATVTVANHSSGAVNLLQLGGLSLASGGSLDLSNNAAILHYADLGNTTSEIRTGYANGTWTGTGITSSAAAADTTHLTALGILLNNNGSGNPIYPTFDGVASAATDVLIKYTYYGDANLDGKVDGSDYSRIDNGFLQGLTGWANGDFNYDNVVNGSDYTLIDNAFNSQGSQLTAQIAGPTAIATAQIAGTTGSSAVPEPSILGLLGIAVPLLGRRRRGEKRGEI